jgi:hypothetical protein
VGQTPGASLFLVVTFNESITCTTVTYNASRIHGFPADLQIESTGGFRYMVTITQNYDATIRVLAIVIPFRSRYKLTSKAHDQRFWIDCYHHSAGP